MLKIGHLAKAIAFAKYSILGQKLKFPKTCQNRFCIHIGVIVCKKTDQKSTKYSRNETMLKIGHLAKAIAFAKYST